MNTQNRESLYSNAFNFLGNLNTGVDPRTGTFSCHFSLPALQANHMNGPVTPLSLAFNPMQTEDHGFGVGWSMNLSCFDLRSSTLSLQTGDSYKAVDNGRELLIADRKLQTFTVTRQGNDYHVLHKSGTVEVLSSDANWYPSALPSEVISPEGRSLYFRYQLFNGERYLSELRDETRRLLTITRERSTVTLTQLPDSESPVSYQLLLGDFGAGPTVQEIILPVQASSWVMEYRVQGPAYVMSRVESPTGGVDLVSYSAPNRGHAAPPGGPGDVPYVVRHEVHPGSEQPVLRTDYQYTSQNFMGYGALHAWARDRDNLYLIRGTYHYGSTETRYVSEREVGRTTRTFNRFHLQTEEVASHQGKSVSTLTTYGDEPGKDWDEQPAWCQLPTQVITRYAEGTSSRETVATTHYDDYGNVLVEHHPDGRTETWEYYPVGGADGCPNDGSTFIRWMKSHTLTPATVADGTTGGAQVTRTDYRYSLLPARNSKARPHLAVVSEHAMTVDGQSTRPLGHTLQRYELDIRHPYYGHVVQAQTIMNQCVTTTDHQRELQGTTLAVTTVLTTHDGETAANRSTQDTLTGLTLTERNAVGVVVAYTYDALGRVLSRTDAVGTPNEVSATCRYVTKGGLRQQIVLVEETDVAGNQRRVYLDGLGRRVREELRDLDLTGETFKEVWRGQYGQDEKLTEEVEQDWRAGQVTALSRAVATYGYDDWGQLSQTRFADNVTEHRQSNPVTLLTKVWRVSASGEQGVQTEILNTTAGEVARVRQMNATGQVTRTEQWQHDGLGRVIGHTLTVPGQTPILTRSSYDAHSRLTTRTLADAVQVVWTYSAHSDDDTPVEVHLKAPGADAVSLGQQRHDGLGRLQYLSCGGQKTEFNYVKGQLAPASARTVSGRMQHYHYAPSLGNALTRVDFSDDSPSLTYHYHPQLAQLLSAQGELGSFAWRYSSSGRAVGEQWTAGDQTWSSAWQHSLMGKALLFTDVDGLEHHTSYDDLGRPVLQRMGTISVSTAYDAWGRDSTTVTRDSATGHSLTQSIGHDAFGRETSRSWVSVTGAMRRQIIQTLGWTQQDQVASRRWEMDGRVLSDEHYAYDVRGRLIQTQVTGEEGPVDPRTGQRIMSQAFVFNALDGYEKVTTVYSEHQSNEMTFEYDTTAPDRPTTIRHTFPVAQTLRLEYDADGRLIDDGQGRRLSWDGEGRLSGVTRGDHASLYRYDPLARLAEVQVAGLTRRRFYHAEHVVCEKQDDTSTTVLRGEGGVFAQHTIARAVREVLLTGSDGQGSVRLEADDQARVIAYTAHGADQGRASSAVGFAGEWRDDVSGCYLLGSYRPYDPVLMMFLAPDSASPFASGGLNRYAYCSGDPVNRVDPDGHSFWKWFVAGLGLVLGAIGTIASFGSLAPVFAAGVAGLTVSGAFTVASAVLGAVSLAAGVASVALEATGHEAAAGVLGWVSLGTGVASAVTGLAPSAAGGVSKLKNIAGRWKSGASSSGKRSWGITVMSQGIDKKTNTLDLLGYTDDFQGVGKEAIVLHGRGGTKLQVGPFAHRIDGKWAKVPKSTQVIEAKDLPAYMRDNHRIDLSLRTDEVHLLSCGAKDGAAQALANEIRRPVVGYSKHVTWTSDLTDIQKHAFTVDASYDTFDPRYWIFGRHPANPRTFYPQ